MEQKKDKLSNQLTKNLLNRLRHFIFSRVFFIVIIIIVEIVLMLLVVDYVSRWLVPMYVAMYILGVCIIIYLVNKPGNPTSRMAWIIIAAAFPIFGLVLYLVFGIARVPSKFRREQLASIAKYKPFLDQAENCLDEVKNESETVYRQARYIWDFSYFPMHNNSELVYYSGGETFYKSLLEELRKAEHYIYIEMFIIKYGQMFSGVLDILKEKVTKGVDVRLMYDDAGSAMYIPASFYKKMEALGIKCKSFNKMRPILLVTMNNRDHRKVIVIDGKVGFTGGMNLADEYININPPFGHWKDAGVMVKGSAVMNMEIMFLQFWGQKAPGEMPQLGLDINEQEKIDVPGYLQPFSDSPTDAEDISRNTHLNMIWQAKKCVWIMTPYFVVGDDIIQALTQAAKNGIDVRIITPHIPDKWLVLEMTRSFYEILLKAGVKVYEYTPGFIHSKVIMVDDQTAVVGSINMDFRSYNIDFEDGVFMYQTPAIKDIKADFEQTFKVSQKITLQDSIITSWWRKMLRAVIRLVAPML